jgi:hypothetical protein
VRKVKEETDAERNTDPGSVHLDAHAMMVAVSVSVPVRVEGMSVMSGMSMSHRVTPAPRTPFCSFSSTSASDIFRRRKVRIDIPSVCFAEIDIRPFTMVARVLCAWVWPIPVSVSILVSHPMTMTMSVLVLMRMRAK